MAEKFAAIDSIHADGVRAILETYKAEHLVDGMHRTVRAASEEIRDGNINRLTTDPIDSVFPYIREESKRLGVSPLELIRRQASESVLDLLDRAGDGRLGDEYGKNPEGSEVRVANTLNWLLYLLAIAAEEAAERFVAQSPISGGTQEHE